MGKHKCGEVQPGQKCVAGGGTVFCSNCPAGYFCQNDGGTDGWQCDVLREEHMPQSDILKEESMPQTAEAVKECHPMDPTHPKRSELFNCWRECNKETEWCVPNNKSSTGWACGPAHKKGEAQPGEKCVPGGGTVFCSNCPNGYFCQDDSDGWQCDVLREGKMAEMAGQDSSAIAV